MNDNVVKFPGNTVAEVPVEEVLQNAIDAGLESVIVLGLSDKGEMFAAASIAGAPFNAWLAQKFILFLHQQV